MVAAASGRGATLLGAVAGRVHSSEARVREWMTAEPVTVSRKTTLEAAVLLMTECGIHHLPVVENERPVGMIGMRDVARSALAHRPTAIGLGL